jgi:hypothetical protein
MGMGSLPYGKSLIPRPLVAIAGLIIISAAAAAGWVAAGQLTDTPVASEPTAPALQVTSGAAALTLRAGWQTEAKVPKLPGLDANTARALAPADGGRGRMVVTMLPDETASVPQPTLDALRVPLPKPSRVTIGSVRGEGYTALSLRGVTGLTDLYTFKTAAGLLTVACVAPLDDPLPTGSCPDDITKAVVTVPRAADPADQLKSALPKITTALNQARVNGRAALRAGADNAAQATAASSLASAYSTAAQAASDVAPPTGEGSQLPDAFRVAAQSYTSLAAAATSTDATAWAQARKEVDAAERAAIAQVAQLSS